MFVYRSGDHQFNKYVSILTEFLCFILHVTNAPSKTAML